MASDTIAKADPHATVCTLSAGDGHTLHIETTGYRGNISALYLHGGPGSGCQPAYHALFDPERFYAVFLDQRGAGRSTPHGERNANTTAHLIADIEAVRVLLGIERWLIVGGSWGATLALAYAQSHPNRVGGIVLRAPFLGTRLELEWAFGTAMSRFYPDLYAQFLAHLPTSEHENPLENYWRRILDPDPAIHRPAAFAWAQAERILSRLTPATQMLALEELPTQGEPFPATPYMEAHYFSNDCFLAPNQLLAGTAKLAGIPGRIVQGRYDLLCPPATAKALARNWPSCDLDYIDAAGHSQDDPGIKAAMQTAIAEIAGRLKRPTLRASARP